MNQAYVRRTLLVLGLAVVAFFLFVPIGRYLLRGAVAEARILWRRRPITEMIADPTTSPAVAAKLRLVLDVRAFAVDSIGLPAKKSFSAFSRLDTDTLVLVLSGAYRDRLLSPPGGFPTAGR